MKRFSEKQLDFIKGIFDSFNHCTYYISRDHSAIDVYISDYQFYIHIGDGFLYLSIYKYEKYNSDVSVCIFMQFFNTFSSLMLTLQGFKFSNL